MSHPRVLDCSVLIVDDEEANLDLLEGLLLSDGYERIVRLGDGREVAATVDSCSPDLILLDLHMPHRNGFDGAPVFLSLGRIEEMERLRTLGLIPTLARDRTAGEERVRSCR